MSFKDYWLNIKDDYRFKINSKDYMIVPDRIIHGKNSMLFYYFNNPMPIKFEYQYTTLTSEDLYDKDNFLKLTKDDQTILKNISIDSKALNTLHDAKVMVEFFNTGKLNLNWKWLIIGFVVFVIVALLIMQMTGYIDLTTLWSSKTAVTQITTTTIQGG